MGTITKIMKRGQRRLMSPGGSSRHSSHVSMDMSYARSSAGSSVDMGWGWLGRGVLTLISQDLFFGFFFPMNQKRTNANTQQLPDTCQIPDSECQLYCSFSCECGPHAAATCHSLKTTGSMNCHDPPWSSISSLPLFAHTRSNV